ncbi:hypothetical protein [Sphaerisporangium aureirubrum]|uniref:HAD family hydrolase n=1 Tax=Sphaerisporangium aureirubrum TaxID=1544736 RepID=A0ABW1ND74_9ACTN
MASSPVDTIAIDFDCIASVTSDGNLGAPAPGALDGLRALQQRYAVYILTSRDPEQAREWFTDLGANVTLDETCDTCEGRITPTPCAECGGHGLCHAWRDQRRILITNHKLPADAYLDAHAIRFISWTQALRDLLPDQAREAQHNRIVDAWIRAWPDLDPAHLGKFATLALDAIDGRVS